MDKFQPRSYSHRGGDLTNDQVTLAVIVLAQLASVYIGLTYYDKMYAMSMVGASAVISSIMCGASQGLLQLIVHHKFEPADLLKFYCWGIINGFWTVSVFCPGKTPTLGIFLLMFPIFFFPQLTN